MDGKGRIIKTHKRVANMSSTNKGTTFLSEFRDFIVFLQSLWGILAGISILFPISSVMADAIPLGYISDDPPGALEYLSIDLITTVATIITLFVILWTFGQRHEIESKKGLNLTKQAWISFVFGFSILILYLVIYHGIYVVVYAPMEIWGGNPIRIIGDVILLIAYSVFFASITRAFMLLGMKEYFSK